MLASRDPTGDRGFGIGIIARFHIATVVCNCNVVPVTNTRKKSLPTSNISNLHINTLQRMSLAVGLVEPCDYYYYWIQQQKEPMPTLLGHPENSLYSLISIPQAAGVHFHSDTVPQDVLSRCNRECLRSRYFPNSIVSSKKPTTHNTQHTTHNNMRSTLLSLTTIIAHVSATLTGEACTCAGIKKCQNQKAWGCVQIDGPLEGPNCVDQTTVCEGSSISE
ncbi:uncharacterized protein MYCFIDRAFT_169125 [Pseudocercospora fijiensis CIRAD86]|uniref:Uncharacterized protein n=1 Tax=Pseudocercospora fijiensis (strain CIRAD86) TaxID=383855 RepID=N1Q5M7_PSEFD|nr:uncharacterized protein MYCFIDRAFT_169125 [Pseudocercospora fijiensis CIRAD86]EME87265.1 hypothetical protein MYCFIDRAFT_169125 [Pseudocercospora fijiensis CIRAD86]